MVWGLGFRILGFQAFGFRIWGLRVKDFACWARGLM